jgi:hypothetical protein
MRALNSDRRALATAAALFAIVLVAPTRALGADDVVDVEVRIVDAEPGAGPPIVDPRLARFAADLRSLPFKAIRLRRTEDVAVSVTSHASIEVAGTGGDKHFLSLTPLGRDSSRKLRLQLALGAHSFSTRIALPNGGTTMLVVPRHEASTKGLVLIVTARAR